GNTAPGSSRCGRPRRGTVARCGSDRRHHAGERPGCGGRRRGQHCGDQRRVHGTRHRSGRQALRRPLRLIDYHCLRGRPTPAFLLLIEQDMSRNSDLFTRASKTIPGGVNSPVRAFRSVGGTPRFIQRAQGAYIWDADGTRYIDYVGSWGPAILGHAHPEVIQAVQKAAENGLSFGAPTEAEIEIAEAIVKRMPSMEQVRLVSSGTEATMSAIRLARGYTGRPRIIKFEGCYHGHADSLLVKAGSGMLTFGNPTSAGVPAEFIQHTLVLDFNNLDAVAAAFEKYPDDIACIIVEPIAGNMNLIKPRPGFLEGLRELCTRHGAVLIFDEVMTGFRAGPQG